MDASTAAQLVPPATPLTLSEGEYLVLLALVVAGLAAHVAAFAQLRYLERRMSALVGAYWGLRTDLLVGGLLDSAARVPQGLEPRAPRGGTEGGDEASPTPGKGPTPPRAG